MRTERRIAVITGGTRGIGRAIALSLVAAGVDVVITYRSDRTAAMSVLEEIQKMGGTGVSLKLEVGDQTALDQFVTELSGALEKSWGKNRFDFLVNNGGFGLRSTFVETTEAEFDEMMNVHFKGVFFLTQRLLPLLADGGRIVNISTGLTRFVAPASAAYASVKGAVDVLTRHLAAELGPRGITVNSIAPGPIATDFGGGMLRIPDVQKRMAAGSALGRIGEPEDIGGAVAALLSEGNRWITAQRIEVSGGTNI